MKAIHFGISVVIYLLFWCVFSYLLVFLGGPFLDGYAALPAFMKTVDSGPVLLALPGLPPAIANAALILAFGLQHSLMARSGFKAIVTRLVPESLERSVYVLATCTALTWLYFAWQPMETAIWALEGPWSALPVIVFLAGAGLVLWSTFMISHGQLFGIAQSWAALKGSGAVDDQFRTPSLYRFSRHPMYLGILIVFWSTPVMTVGHFIAASLFSIYVFIGIGYEERDLLRNFGDAYSDYMERVPQIFPIGFRKPNS